MMMMHECVRWMRIITFAVVGLSLWLLLPFSKVDAAQANISRIERFVLIVASNRADESNRELRYADDDGVLYAQLFGFFSGHVSLLTILDDETQIRFPGMAGRTQPPTLQNLQAEIASTFEKIKQAKRQPGVQTELLFIYIGHGGMGDDGRGYLHLVNAHYNRTDLYRDLIDPSPADYTHLIVDACNAFSIVAGRGDEDRRAGDDLFWFDRFLQGHDLEGYPNVGVLFAADADRETHEWSQIQAGVFSHLVRSALSGAADVNGDMQIEYSEVAAFVDAASRRLSRVGKRFSTFAWPPTRNRRVALLDLRTGSDLRQMILDPTLSGRFFLEDEAGSRVVEFNKSAGETLHLWLAAQKNYFIRDDVREQSIERGSGTIRMTLPPQTPYATARRGAMERLLEQELFAEPFSKPYYQGFVSGHPQLVPVDFADALATRQLQNVEGPGVWRFDLAYQVSKALLLARGYEQGGLLRAGYRLWQNWELLSSVEVGFAAYDGQTSEGVLRLAVLPGIGYRLPLLWGIEANALAQAGWAMIMVKSDKPSTDASVVATRIQGGLGWRSPLDLTMQVNIGWSAYLMTLDGRDKMQTRPEFEFCISWTPDTFIPR